MARSYVVPLGLLHLTDDPTGHSAGDTYYNTVSSKIRVYDGTNWQDAGVSLQDVNSAISSSALASTDDLPEGVQNLYSTPAHVYNAITSGTQSNITFTYNATPKTIDVSVPTVQGTQGTQGASIQGTQGVQGTQGTVGQQGTQGTTGAQGTQGTQGTQGVQGVQGVQGIQGVQSPSIQGATGTAGTQGTQGTQGLVGQVAADPTTTVLLFGGM